ncbi:MAG TPA: hypothetical protein VMG12_33620 [Polyangiaceae bacterium]|nr:hypothetical protein [Polyangiaceae bacterium]
MWVRRSAIKPVPRFARVPASAIAAARALLSGTDDEQRAFVRERFERLRVAQHGLTSYLQGRLQPGLDARALALGQLLAVAVHISFESTPGLRLRAASDDLVAATDAALGADEELRRSDPMDALDSEDIVAIEQPALVAFVNEHVGRTLEQHAGSIDVDHVAQVFRAILVEILALSQAVSAPPGHPAADGEALA